MLSPPPCNRKEDLFASGSDKKSPPFSVAYSVFLAIIDSIIGDGKAFAKEIMQPIVSICLNNTLRRSQQPLVRNRQYIKIYHVPKS